MSARETIQSTVKLLRRLEAILEAEEGINWLAGIQAVRRAGDHHVAAGDEAGALNAMGSMYRSMHSGPGGFDDFFVWRDTASERTAANEELNRIKDQLWRVLG